MNATNVASTLEEEHRAEHTGSVDDSGSSKRIIAASLAAVVSSLVTTPLDVVKTRMQTHNAASFSGRAESSCSSMDTVHRSPVRRMVHQIPKLCTPHGGFLQSVLALFQGTHPGCVARPWRVDQFALCHCVSASPSYQGVPSGEACSTVMPQPRVSQPTMLSTIRSIYRQEGVSVLWRGLDTSLLLTVPMVSIYMPLYDILREKFTSQAPGGLDLGVYAPAVAGAAARVVAVMATAPLDLVRTRQQALTGNEPQYMSPSATTGASPTVMKSNTSTMAVLRDALYNSGWSAAGGYSQSSHEASRMLALLRLWAGVGATIARDVPFTIVYWSLLEPTRQLLMEQQLQRQQQLEVSSKLFMDEELQQQQARNSAVLANLLAGASAGTVAAILTTPADVVKTRLQTCGGLTIAEAVRHIYKEEGARGLMRGWVPRAVRTAPACAIVIASYELIKTLI